MVTVPTPYCRGLKNFKKKYIMVYCYYYEAILLKKYCLKIKKTL